MQTDTYFLPSNVDNYYHLCAVMDLSFLKVKHPSVDSTLMFPALPYTDD